MTRKIKIYTTAGMPGTIETNVTTLGALKPLLSQREINYSGMKMLVGETKNELSVDEATLPEGDFKLYLMPAKTKSGVDLDAMEDTVEDIHATAVRLEIKINKLLEKLESATSPSTGVASNSMSAEDQREIEELKRLAAGGSVRNEWD